MKNMKGGMRLRLLTFVIIIAVTGLAAGAWAFESQSSNVQNVRVEVIPVQLVAGQPAVFKIRMNTHSVELSYDMVKLSTLKDDKGREYQALKWNGDPPGGHHRNGALEFQAITAGVKSITLRIKTIAGVPERVFEWKLE